MKTLDELRKEFENIDVIKAYVKMYCVFDSNNNDYNPKNRFNNIHDVRCEFVNGAWFMFQELNKNETT